MEKIYMEIYVVLTRQYTNTKKARLYYERMDKGRAL